MIDNPIKNYEDHQRALRKVECLMMASLDTEEGKLLDMLVDAIIEYEEMHYPISVDSPSPEDVAELYGNDFR